jgi:hypothetical protein
MGALQAGLSEKINPSLIEAIPLFAETRVLVAISPPMEAIRQIICCPLVAKH